MCFYSNKMLPHSSHVEKFPSLLDFVLWFFSCFSPKGAMAAGGVSVGRHGFFVTAKFGKSCSHSRALSPRQDASESPRRKHTCSWKCWPKRDLKHPFTTWVFCCYCIERVYQFPINKQEHGVKMVRYNLIASNKLRFTIQTTNGAHLQNSSGEFPAKIQIYIYIVIYVWYVLSTCQKILSHLQTQQESNPRDSRSMAPKAEESEPWASWQ